MLRWASNSTKNPGDPGSSAVRSALIAMGATLIANTATYTLDTPKVELVQRWLQRQSVYKGFAKNSVVNLLFRGGSFFFYESCYKLLPQMNDIGEIVKRFFLWFPSVFVAQAMTSPLTHILFPPAAAPEPTQLTKVLEWLGKGPEIKPKTIRGLFAAVSFQSCLRAGLSLGLFFEMARWMDQYSWRREGETHEGIHIQTSNKPKA